MIPEIELAESVEPQLQYVCSYQVRRADSDVEELVEQIMGLLGGGATLVDLSRHDHRGTVIELRAQPTGEAAR